ncbi:iron complex outermembrane recepter protein [Spirosomataceae bacterium TFI 002]|nr:iron complex outermembrane recepter protein [Spirosomataceae bacterium TFI 002]
MKYIICGIMLHISFQIIAQDSTAIDLNEVSVTANIIQTDLQKTARNVSIISAIEIAEAPVKSLDGILQYALNLDVRSRSPLGVQADISIRGGHFDQTLIMVDGIKMNDPQTGHHSLNLPIPMEMIERIEVLQGGASRVFGPSAFAGIINIITKKIIDKPNQIRATVGQNGLYALGGQTGFQKSKTKLFVTADKMHSNGYAYNTAFDKLNIYTKLDVELKSGFLAIQGGYLSNEFGASNFYFPSFYDQYEEVKAKFGAITWQKNFTNNFSSTLNASFRQHNDLYDFNKYLENAVDKVNFHRSDVYELEWKGRKIHQFGATAFGASFRNEFILSNRLGTQRAVNVAIPNYEGLFYDQSFDRKNWSGFLEHQKKVNDFLFSGGAMVNVNSQFGVQVYPGLDVSYALNSNTSFYTSYNRSLRLPTFTELYLNGSTVIADENLLPEKANAFEVGYKYKDDGFMLNLASFYRQTKDAIDKVKRPDLPIPTMENIDNINFGGIEVNSKIVFPKLGKFKSLQFNYAFLMADRKENGFQSFYTLNFLKHKASVGANFEWLPNLTTSLWYTFKDRQGSYQFSANEPVIPYENVHLVDLRLAYSFKGIRFFADVNNLLDYKYFEFGFVEQPGRWISTGLSYAF